MAFINQPLHFLTIFFIAILLLWFCQSPENKAQMLHFLTIFCIAIFLLWFSQSPENKAQLNFTFINLQLFLFLSPFILILYMMSFSGTGWRFRFPFWQPEYYESVQGAGGLPWGTAIVVGLILVLLSYQSTFRSMWFGPLKWGGRG
jgi:hypothetical protein